MKDQVLRLYRTLTGRRRQQLLARFKSAGTFPVAILFYHRVADTHANDWTMSCRDFERQIEWLRANFDIVDLAEAQRRIQAKRCDRPTVALTFDDGYRDNADFAIPLLIQHRLPATYFVSTEFVRHGSAFPHDVQAGQPLSPNTIDQLQCFAGQGIEIGGHTRTHCDLGQVQDTSVAEDEILGGLQQLEDWLGERPRYFAFPFGMPCNMSQLAVNVLTAGGVSGFCSAYGAWNWPGSPGVHLRRIHADPGLERLKNWLTLDPRKLRDDHELPFAESTTASISNQMSVHPTNLDVHQGTEFHAS